MIAAFADAEGSVFLVGDLGTDGACAAIMEQGVLIQDDSPMNLYHAPANDFVRDFLSLDQLVWTQDGTLMKIVKKGE